MKRAILNVTAVLALAIAGFSAEGTRLTVQVNSAETGKPVDRASVVVHFRHGLNPIKMRKLRTTWETKTSQQGTVSIPEIPMGEITVQVIASNYQTFGDVFTLNQADQTITVKLNPPQPQYSEDAKKK